MSDGQFLLASLGVVASLGWLVVVIAKVVDFIASVEIAEMGVKILTEKRDEDFDRYRELSARVAKLEQTPNTKSKRVSNKDAV